MNKWKMEKTKKTKHLSLSCLSQAKRIAKYFLYFTQFLYNLVAHNKKKHKMEVNKDRCNNITLIT